MVDLNLSRDLMILAPILAVVIAFLTGYLPNTENYVSTIFLICSGFVGLYGATRGTGSIVTSENTLGLPPGVVRFILGAVCVGIGLLWASAQKDESYVMLMLGLCGEFIGVSIPGIANYLKSR
ncbi:MAG: hypothetical protein ACFFE8_08410 [Candidatus Heimdallarchaeota archaeon]